MRRAMDWLPPAAASLTLSGLVALTAWADTPAGACAVLALTGLTTGFTAWAWAQWRMRRRFHHLEARRRMRQGQ